jgi:hypothetical protein
MSRPALAAVAVVVVALAGCSHGMKQVKRTQTACERARETAAKQPGHHALQGDVDGDRVPDRVALLRPRQAPTRCAAVLVVRTRSRTLTRAFPATLEPGVPALDGLAALAPGRLHIVLTLQEGASTAFASAFAVQDGRITELSIPDSEGFAYFGSVTHYGGVDCVRGRPGLIEERTWSTLASAQVRLYRTFYRVRGDRFQLVRKEVLKKIPRVFDPSSGARGEQPFPSCMRVRAE